MFPAARKGDPVSHDLIVPSGVIGPPITAILRATVFTGDDRVSPGGAL